MVRAVLENERVTLIARGIFIALLVAGVVVSSIALRISQQALSDQREGRSIAVQTTCIAISAVVDAGRATLLAGGRPQPQPFERNLLKLGFPPLAKREKAAQIAAATYSRSIASRVAAITGRVDLVKPDGSLDCNRLREAART